MAWYDQIVESLGDAVDVGLDVWAQNETGGSSNSGQSNNTGNASNNGNANNTSDTGNSSGDTFDPFNPPVWMGFSQKELMIGGGAALAVVLLIVAVK